MFNIVARAQPTVSVAPETLFHVGPIAVTNSQMLGVIGTALLLWILLVAVRQIRTGKRGRFITAVLFVFESLYDTAIDVIGDKEVAKKVMPLAITLMLFFWFNNWLGILPILGSVTYHGTAVFRGYAADMNTTFALAFISIFTAQAWAIKKRGFFGNIRRYVSSPFKDPLHSFEGALEIVAEISRTLALSLRMFGNVFGGEVLLAVIAYLASYAAPVALPVFYVLELFVGAVQAYVFFMLTIAFISLGLPQEDEHDSHQETPDKIAPESAS